MLKKTLACLWMAFMPATAVTAPVMESIDMQVPVPPAPVRIDGEQWLLYELHLTNFSREPFAVRALEILAAGKGSPIVIMRGDGLAERIGRIGGSVSESRLAIPPGQRVVVYLEFPVKGPAPDALEHRLELTQIDAATNDPAFVTSDPVPVRDQPPAVLGPPLAGGPWAAIHHPSWPRGHRRMIYTTDGRARIPGRFAIDWILLDNNGRTAHGNSDIVDNWLGHGVPVLAVADGIVVRVRDDVQESETLSAHPDHPLEDATGNYVALDIGDSQFVFYEHLKPGSIRVRPGERVTRGQPIGSLGFTGDSTGPHLHLHVADGNSPLGAEGLPFVIDHFKVLGTYDSLESFGEKPWQPLDESREAERHRERPAPNVVVEFTRTTVRTEAHSES